MIFVSYPNNPTGAVIEDDFFARLVAFAREHDIVVVHDNAYADITFDGYVAPSFLETPGAREVGVELFSLSKSYNMTGWRAGAMVGNPDVVDAYWRLKTNMDSGMFGAAAARRRGCAHRPAGLGARALPRSTPTGATCSSPPCGAPACGSSRPRAPSTCGRRCPPATPRAASPSSS